MVATVVTVSLFGLAYVQISNTDHTHNSRTGWILMITLVAALGLTVQYWRRWFYFVPAYLGLRLGSWLMLGWFSPGGFILVAFPLLMFAMAAMSFRFSESVKLRLSDRTILLVTAAFLFAAMLELFAQPPNAMALVYAAIGDLALFTSRIYATRKSRRHASHAL
ncbi:MAG TPA: hypothetical protein VH302_16715 [Bryobacteraceae bacterium]|nr:hypothetical protein [Bryobacteraceae bacterium]